MLIKQSIISTQGAREEKCSLTASILKKNVSGICFKEFCSFYLEKESVLQVVEKVLETYFHSCRGSHRILNTICFV